MDNGTAHLTEFGDLLRRSIHIVGNGLEAFGTFIIVVGIAWSTFLFVARRTHYETYRIRIGRSLLLGLEILVAPDIVKTIALDLTVMSLSLLAGLVLIRTFLSWTLVLENEHRWPWQREVADRAASSGAPKAPQVSATLVR
jgi:uncharacterized membrane protein